MEKSALSLKVSPFCYPAQYVHNGKGNGRYKKDQNGTSNYEKYII